MCNFCATTDKFLPMSQEKQDNNDGAPIPPITAVATLSETS